MKGIGAIVVALLIASAGSASAHSLGESYLFLDLQEKTVEARVEILLGDLDDAVKLGAVGDGKVTEAELTANIDKVRDYITARLKLGARGQTWALAYTEHGIIKTPDGQYAHIAFKGTIDALPEAIDIEYGVLFDENPEYRGVLVVEANARTGHRGNHDAISLVFNPSARKQTLDLTTSSAQQMFAMYLEQGVRHILIGADHILFLIVLLLPAVLRRRDRKWHPAEGFAPALAAVAKRLALFTLGYCITLGLAVMQVAALPSQLVETIIAASVVALALHNILPEITQRVGAAIFAFGLFHGFGLAGVVSVRGLSHSSLTYAFVGYDLGIAIALTAIAVVAFPILFTLRRTPLYGRAVMPIASAGMLIVGGWWFIERAFGLGA